MPPSITSSGAAVLSLERRSRAAEEAGGGVGGGSDELLDLADEEVLRLVDSRYERLARRSVLLDVHDSEEELLRAARTRQAAELSETNAAQLAAQPVDVSEVATKTLAARAAAADGTTGGEAGRGADPLLEHGLALALDDEELAGGRRPRSFASGVFEEGVADSTILDDIAENDAPYRPEAGGGEALDKPTSSLDMTGTFSKLQDEFGF